MSGDEDWVANGKGGPMLWQASPTSIVPFATPLPTKPRSTGHSLFDYNPKLIRKATKNGTQNGSHTNVLRQ